MKSNQKDNFFPKNKFNIIKDSSEANSMKLEKILYKKRGRKSLKIGKRQHSALDDDNIIRKIQVHFISFIIDITNDLIRSVYPNNKNIYFKSINYEFKKTVNHSYIQGLLSKNIGEIVRLEESKKIKNLTKILIVIYMKNYAIMRFLKIIFKLHIWKCLISIIIKKKKKLMSLELK